MTGNTSPLPPCDQGRPPNITAVWRTYCPATGAPEQTVYLWDWSAADGWADD